MTKRPPLTVEVYRDTDNADLSLDHVIEGIEAVRSIATGIEIVRTNRLIRLTQPDAEAVYPRKIRVPRFDADYNVILTGRNILDDDIMNKHGERAVIGGIAIKNIAVISNDSANVSTVTQHETAHMFHVKHSGEAHDGTGHCTNEGCIMRATANVRPTYKTRVKRTRWEKLLKRPGIVQREYVGATIDQSGFCDECTQQLGTIALYLQKIKTGEAIPPAFMA